MSRKKKEKPDRIPLPEDLNKEKKQIVKKKQNPEEIKDEINSPMTLITSNFLFLLFLELKNCVIEKTKVK